MMSNATQGQLRYFAVGFLIIIAVINGAVALMYPDSRVHPLTVSEAIQALIVPLCLLVAITGAVAAAICILRRRMDD